MSNNLNNLITTKTTSVLPASAGNMETWKHGIGGIAGIIGISGIGQLYSGIWGGRMSMSAWNNAKILGY